MFPLKKERITKKLGKGASGTVYAYQKDVDDEKWVVKKIHVGDSEELLNCLPEMVLGFSCDHPCVMPLKGYSVEKIGQEDYYLYLKFPRMKGTLKDKFDQQQRSQEPFPEKEIVKYFYSLVSAVNYLHSKKIYHRDIKLANILLDDNGNARLSDIGVAKHVSDEDMYQPLTGQKGTVQYTAPELLKSESNLTKESLIAGDAWGVGLVMLELCALKNRLFSPYSSRETIQEVQSNLYSELKKIYSKTLVELISKLLNFEPGQRIKIPEGKKILEEEYSCHLSSDLNVEGVETLRKKQKEMLKSYKNSLQDMISSANRLRQENSKLQEELQAYRLFINTSQSRIISEMNQFYSQRVAKLQADHQSLLEESQNSVQPELKMKLVVVGSLSSSKLHLINSLMSQPLKNYTHHEWFDWHSYSLFRSRKEFKLSIFSMPSEEKLGPCFDYYFDGNLVLIIVYSMIDKDSFLSVPYWIKYRTTRGLGENMESIIFIVGTEADCSEKIVKTREAQAIARKHGAFHMEVSSKTGMNIDQLREKILDEIEKSFDDKKKKFLEEKKNGHEKEIKSQNIVLPNRSELDTQDVVLPESQIRISIVGDYSTGKTNLFWALTTSYSFAEDCGLDGSETAYQTFLRHGKPLEARITHVYANEEYLSWYLDGSLVGIILYRIDKRYHFSEVSNWIKTYMKRAIGTEDKPIIFIVGTCLDLSDRREVLKEEAEALASMHGAIHMEVSLKTRENIDELRERIIDEIFKKFTVQPEKKKSSFWEFLGLKN